MRFVRLSLLTTAIVCSLGCGSRDGADPWPVSESPTGGSATSDSNASRSGLSSGDPAATDGADDPVYSVSSPSSPLPEDDDCGGCASGQTCVAKECVRDCGDDVCSEDGVCVGRTAARCGETWTCNPSQITADFNGDVCTMKWACEEGEAVLRCQEKRHDDGSSYDVCTCSLGGKEGNTFTWPGQACGLRPGHIDVINAECGWSFPSFSPGS